MADGIKVLILQEYDPPVPAPLPSDSTAGLLTDPNSESRDPNTGVLTEKVRRHDYTVGSVVTLATSIANALIANGWAVAV